MELCHFSAQTLQWLHISPRVKAKVFKMACKACKVWPPAKSLHLLLFLYLCCSLCTSSSMNSTNRIPPEDFAFAVPSAWNSPRCQPVSFPHFFQMSAHWGLPSLSCTITSLSPAWALLVSFFFFFFLLMTVVTLWIPYIYLIISYWSSTSPLEYKLHKGKDFVSFSAVPPASRTMHGTY